MACIGDVRGRSVLDLGCGAGFYARLMADGGASPVVAVDAVPAMLAGINDPRIQAVAGDIAAIGLRRSFDVVLLAGVMEFADDAVAALANARRHLSSGGRIVALLPPDNVAGRLYRLYHRRHGLEIALFDPHRLSAMTAAAGLAVTTVRPVRPYGLVCALAAL